MENWRDIPGREGLYQASDCGKIRSLFSPEKTLLRQSANPKGYLKVWLTRGGREYCFVHRLIAMTFLENPQALPVINHLNGDKSDNRSANLEWTTQRENLIHARRTGLRKPNAPLMGEANKSSKITAAEVIAIRERLRLRDPSKDKYKDLIETIALDHGISPSRVDQIYRRKAWIHIP